jgi:NifU-like protein involved in Fe-S cluster formation
MSNIVIPTKTLPVNFGPLRDADGNARIKGPCGDTMEFWVGVENNEITIATYTTDGCYYSIMCGSAAALLAVGKETGFIQKFKPEFVLAIVDDIPKDHQHCALLAVNTLKAAVNEYLA